MRELFRNRIVLAGLIVFMTALYFVNMGLEGKRKKNETVNVYSYLADGLGVFYDLANRIDKNKIQVSKGAFLDKIDPNEYKSLLILSPKVPITKRETDLIKDYVNEGGTLIVSIVNKREMDIFEDLFSALEFKLDISANKEFKGKSVKSIRGDNEISFLSESETYAIYSAKVFGQVGKQTNTASDFFISTDIGNGRLEVMLGVPVISNALIGLNDNRQVAFEILNGPGKVLVDEYRHFFTEKTLADLFLNPSFFIPILGMAILVFIFMIFSDYPPNEKPLDDKLAKEIGYHQLNSQIVFGLWKSKNLFNDAVSNQAKMLVRKFPASEDEILGVVQNLTEKGQPGVVLASKQLVLLHQKLLKEKGIK